jgi:two-component system, chemotaxis family, sensor kinase CheA
MEILDDEIISGYIEESREHLADIENDLLTIEEQGEQIDRDLVNKVFRAAHSIKGGAGFLNLIAIKELSHGVENILDMIRNNALIPSRDVVNLLLLSFDKLREMINNYQESNRADISQFTAKLAALAEEGSVSEKPPAPREEQPLSESLIIPLPASDTFLEVSRVELESATKEGGIAYLLALDLFSDVPRPGVTLTDFIDMLDHCGTVLDGRIALDLMGSLDEEAGDYLPFFVLMVSSLTCQELTAALNINSDKILPLDESILSTPDPLPDAGTPSLFPADPELSSPSVHPGEASPVTTAPIRQKAAPTVTTTPQESGNAPGSLLAESTLRINVSLLDILMNLAGELVLSRNQLLQAILRGDQMGLKNAGHRINSVTSELQETIMLTRMQPIGTIFNKFTRVVRDLSRELGKEINLVISGKDVELDKTIIEGLSDPLTHLVRNAVDHGIENPAERRRTGKAPSGTIRLHAYHEAGQVIIEISDDGRGINPDKVVSSALSKGLITPEQARLMSDKDKSFLIMMPGFSTAEQVTDISGRGVGMDVVKTNIEKLNGLIDIESESGRGSLFQIKLPLTLAIIPCLFVETSDRRYAIPQVSVVETIRIGEAQIPERIQRVGDAEVLLLRGDIIPIIHLNEALGIPALDSGTEINLVIVTNGIMQYGMAVQQLHDSEEIVVKPLGRHVRHLKEYAGATIMGDGQVALILDASGLAQSSGIATISGAARTELKYQEPPREITGENRALLTFYNGTQQLAVPLELVERVEKIAPQAIEYVSGHRVMQYHDQVMPLLEIGDITSAGMLDEERELVVIVFAFVGREFGLVANTPVDSIDCTTAVDGETLRQPGIVGSVIIQKQTVLIVDIAAAVTSWHPEWFETEYQETAENSYSAPAPLRRAGGTPTILLAEDSDFFREQVRKIIEDQGYTVVACPDGALAWEALNEHAESIKLVVSDIEMPNLDGLGLTRKIRGDSRFRDLPVITLSSLAGEENVAVGTAAGVTRYLVKLDRDELAETIAAIYPVE